MGRGNVSERRLAAPEVGVTSVILALGPDQGAGRRLWLPLVRRIQEPFLGQWALPGGPVRADRSLERCALESLADTTDLHPAYLEQLYTFGGPERSCGGVPMVSVCYWALVGQADVDQRDGERGVRWFPEDALPPLAFDHDRIVRYALWRLRHRMDTPQVVRQLVGERFTLGQLHDVTEAVLGHAVDLPNFRRRVLASGSLEDTGELMREGLRRPAVLYRFRDGTDTGDGPWLPQGVSGDELEAIAGPDGTPGEGPGVLGALTTFLR